MRFSKSNHQISIGGIPLREYNVVLLGPRTISDSDWVSGESVWDALAEVTDGCSDAPPSEVMQGWTDEEKLIAYNWAICERLRRMGSAGTMPPRPTFTIEEEDEDHRGHKGLCGTVACRNAENSPSRGLTTVTITLEIEGGGIGDAHDAVTSALDDGVLQDYINERGVTVRSAVSS